MSPHTSRVARREMSLAVLYGSQTGNAEVSEGATWWSFASLCVWFQIAFLFWFSGSFVAFLFAFLLGEGLVVACVFACKCWRKKEEPVCPRHDEYCVCTCL